MRKDDLNGGSIKALLILLLVAANIVASMPREHARRHQSQTTSPAVDAARTERGPSEKHPQ